ncbi:MAG TPA: GNAT family N-acetyltransferase [Conexibacter sp.]|jgi:CelD/BcsL family acetyltransferase involved in cellulose biosynthesis
MIDVHLDAPAPALGRLYESVGAPVTARPRWLAAWTGALGDAAQPWTVVACSEGEIEAAAILLTRIGQDEATVLSSPRAGFDDVFAFPARNARAAAEIAAAIATQMEEHARGWRLDLQQLPPDDLVADALLDRLPGARSLDGQAVPRVLFSTQRDVDAYLTASRRKELRRHRARLAADGVRARVEVLADPGEIAAVLPRVESVHRSRDRARGRASDLDDPTILRFWRAVILSHSLVGAVRLFALRVGEALAAYVVVLVDGAAYRVFDGRLDSAWCRYAPGRIIEAAVLEHALADPRVTELDWMSSVAPAALLAMTDARPTRRIVCDGR